MLTILIFRATNRIISTLSRNRNTFELISNQQHWIHVAAIGEIFGLFPLFIIYGFFTIRSSIFYDKKSCKITKLSPTIC